MPSQEELRRLFEYDEETGELKSKVKRGKLRIGDVAGAVIPIGYVFVGLGNRNYQYAHRIIWTMMCGSIPSGKVIDHINHVTTDNRWANLRLVTHSGNHKNSRLYASNQFGVPGISRTKHGRWCVQIASEGQTVVRKNFKSFEDATAYRLSMNTQYGFHDNHGTTLH